MAVSVRIRQLRREQRLTLTALAEKAGISRGYLSELENERATDPSASVLKAIAEALGTTTAVLMEEDARIVPAAIPAPLREAARRFEIPEEDLPGLASIKFRNYQPATPEDWNYLYQSIRRSIIHDPNVE